MEQEKRGTGEKGSRKAPGKAEERLREYIL